MKGTEDPGIGCVVAAFWIIFALAVGGTVIAIAYNLILSWTGHYVWW